MLKETLKSEVRKINDTNYDLFAGFPKNCATEACNRWGNAIFIYTIEIRPNNINVDLAKNIFIGSIRQICYISGTLRTSATIFENSLILFANELLDGFPGYNGIMPIGRPNLYPVFYRGYRGNSAEKFAEDFSTEVDRWMRTGTAINITTGATVNWS